VWCFIDESWSPEGYRPRFGVVLGVLLLNDQLPELEQFLFGIRRKYFGTPHAKDRRRDLKGKELLSRYALDLWSKNHSVPRNICVVREILALPKRRPDFFLQVFAATVYRQDATRPALASPDHKHLAEPFVSLIQNVSVAAYERFPTRSVNLVFDQRMCVQTELAIAVTNFIAGRRLRNVSPYPYFAVSNVSPGIQVADIFAHIIAKRAQKIGKVMHLYNELTSLQWVSKGVRPQRYGLVRFNERVSGQQIIYRVRRTW
jgi:hypothetical protein